MTDITIFKYKVAIPTSIALIASHYTDIYSAIIALLIMTSLDTISKIHYTGIEKGLSMNPFKLSFWRHINSGGLRQMSKKVFGEYFKYLIIVFVVDYFILKSLVKVPFVGRDIDLPTATLYLFTLIEIRSIAENIGENGGNNYLDFILKFLPKNMQDFYTTMFPKNKS